MEYKSESSFPHERGIDRNCDQEELTSLETLFIDLDKCNQIEEKLNIIEKIARDPSINKDYDCTDFEKYNVIDEIIHIFDSSIEKTKILSIIICLLTRENKDISILFFESGICKIIGDLLHQNIDEKVQQQCVIILTNLMSMDSLIGRRISRIFSLEDVDNLFPSVSNFTKIILIYYIFAFMKMRSEYKDLVSKEDIMFGIDIIKKILNMDDKILSNKVVKLLSNNIGNFKEQLEKDFSKGSQSLVVFLINLTSDESIETNMLGNLFIIIGYLVRFGIIRNIEDGLLKFIINEICVSDMDLRNAVIWCLYEIFEKLQIMDPDDLIMIISNIIENYHSSQYYFKNEAFLLIVVLSGLLYGYFALYNG